MKTITRIGAQGDLLIIKVAEVPTDAVERKAAGDHHVVAHSETGHHHVVAAQNTALWDMPDDSMTNYLTVKGAFALLKHKRPFDTHEALRCPAGIWKIHRQRESSPEGWRRVED